MFFFFIFFVRTLFGFTQSELEDLRELLKISNRELTRELTGRLTGQLAYSLALNAVAEVWVKRSEAFEFVGNSLCVKDGENLFIISSYHNIVNDDSDDVGCTLQFKIKSQKSSISFNMSEVLCDNKNDMLVIPVNSFPPDIQPVNFSKTEIKLGQTLYGVFIQDGTVRITTCLVTQQGLSKFVVTNCGGKEGFSGLGYLNSEGEYVATHHGSLLTTLLESYQEKFSNVLMTNSEEVVNNECSELLRSFRYHVNEKVYTDCMKNPFASPSNVCGDGNECSSFISCLNNASSVKFDMTLFKSCTHSIAEMGDFAARNSGAVVVEFTKNDLKILMSKKQTLKNICKNK